MFQLIEPIFDSLFSLVQSAGGTSVREYTKGFIYTDTECTKDATLFPYAFLAAPTTSQVRGIAHPFVYGYDLTIPLVCITLADAGDRQGLIFDGGSANTNKGAVELVTDISRTIWDARKNTFPIPQQPRGNGIDSWTLGRMGRPRQSELRNAGFTRNPVIRGYEVQFIFTCREAGPGIGG